ncbi:hypothetical protein Ahy_B01g052762 isoform B [Arachis hypogaea]|uniref:Transposase MuDR plant domain-containing protein n=1 Tax=Arachis hypogaea TaxID=3818 RepID=A0A445AQA8_ARAHY|nr:hypothetical protein Ahy_B01g052762 isoform B [Arachis hypogaea]
MIELYVAFKELAISHEVNESFVNEGNNTYCKKENNSDSDEEFLTNNDMLGENDEKNESTNTEVQTVINMVTNQHPFGLSSFIRSYEHSEFAIGIEFNSKRAVVMAIRNYTISKGVDYKVFESEPLTFYTKCLQYGKGCDWLIRANHLKLDFDTIADAIRPLVEADPSIKI